MDPHRLVDIRAGTARSVKSCGSGYLVGPGLVLTAGHVVDTWPVIRLWIGHRNYGPLLPTTGVLYWHDAGLDVALIQISTQAELGEPPRWGYLSGTHTVRYNGLGFPRFAAYKDTVRGVEQLDGDLRPFSTGDQHGYVLDQAAAPISNPAAAAAAPTAATPANLGKVRQWSGVSGAAVFCQGLLIAVVTRDDDMFGNRRLHTCPVRDFFPDTGFQATLARDHPRSETELFPVELDSLLQRQNRSTNPRISPSVLLRADSEALQFHGREDERKSLQEWCESTEKVAVQLYLAAGGWGKTRLARQVIRERKACGWIAGFLIPELSEEPLDLTPLVDVANPILLVIDYADARTRQIQRLLKLLREHDRNSPIRILLLARSPIEWWENLTTRYPELLRNDPVIPMLSLYRGLTERENAFDEALRTFSKALPEENTEATGSDALALVPFPDDLDADRFGSPLTLQMTALLELFRLSEDSTAPAATPDGLIREILLHEKRYWEDVAADQKLTLKPRTLGSVVAAATVLGASSRQEGRKTLRQLHWLAGQSEDRITAVDDWLRSLYPAATNQYWGTLQPDKIAEYHLEAVTAAEPEFMAQVLERATPDQRVRLFSFVHRATSPTGTAVAQIRPLVGKFESEAVIAAVTAGQGAPWPREGGQHLYSALTLDERRAILDRWHGPEELPR